MEPNVGIVTLGSADLETSRECYRDRLGWPQDEREGDIAVLDAAGTSFAASSWESLADAASSTGSGVRGSTLAHNVDSAANLDVVRSEAEDAGKPVVKPAAELDWGGYSEYFSDPDGFLWEVAWNPHFSTGSWPSAG